MQVDIQEEAGSVEVQEEGGPVEVLVQMCLLEPMAVDLSDKGLLHRKPSYLTDLMEQLRHQDSSKTLSNGASEWEASDEELGGQGEVEVARPPSPPSPGPTKGCPPEEGKLAGEAKLSGEALEWLAHPAVGLLAVCLACLHTLTGLDLLTAFGVLLAVVAHISLLFH